MRIAITGALGHIGSRLIRHLPEAIPGCEIVLINHDSAERYYPLFDLPDAGCYQFVSADVREADLKTMFARTNADLVNRTDIFAAVFRVTTTLAQAKSAYRAAAAPPAAR